MLYAYTTLDAQCSQKIGYSIEGIANSIIEDIESLYRDELDKDSGWEPVSFAEVHNICDANTLGVSEKLLDAFPMDEAIKILNRAQGMVDAYLRKWYGSKS